MQTQHSQEPTKPNQVSLTEHTDLIKRLCSAVSAYFQPTKVTIHQVEISEKVLQRSVAEVFSSSPASNADNEETTCEDAVTSHYEEESTLVSR